MKRTRLSVAEVEHHLNDLQWGLLYYQDDIQLKPIVEIGAADINSSKLLEAHLFGEQRAIHIFEYDGQFRATLTEDDSQEQIDRKHELTGKFKLNGCTDYLWVRDYISFDEDGMAYIEYSRPLKVEYGRNQQCIR
jgi:hypothetical protein